MSYPISTTTNLGALTTTFKPPSDCSTPYVHNPELVGFWGNSCESNSRSSFPALRSTCFPGSYAAYRNDDNVDQSIAVYSPGLACPSGWSAACSISRRSGEPPPSKGQFWTPADWYIWNMIKEGETATGCCPSRYICDEGGHWDCEWNATPGDVLTGLTYDGNCSPTPTSSAVESADYVANAGRIILVRAATDGSPAETGPGGGQAGDGSSSSGGSLSTGGKIAIGVVVPAVVILISVGVFFLLRRRKHRRGGMPDQEPQTQGTGEVESTGMKAELEGTKGAAVTGANVVAHEKPELDTSSPGNTAPMSTTSETATEERLAGGVTMSELSPDPGWKRTPELQGSNYTVSELGTAPGLPSELDSTPQEPPSVHGRPTTPV